MYPKSPFLTDIQLQYVTLNGLAINETINATLNVNIIGAIRRE